eukprot:GHVS01028025.1.p1 GENE.GHVS01028025.1~~GHVS01028025.1.p1  ORF type:complete len:561 (-),score=90.31 GHVS01028025.1:88-1770(-)
MRMVCEKPIYIETMNYEGYFKKKSTGTSFSSPTSSSPLLHTSLLSSPQHVVLPPPSVDFSCLLSTNKTRPPGERTAVNHKHDRSKVPAGVCRYVVVFCHVQRYDLWSLYKDLQSRRLESRFEGSDRSVLQINATQLMGQSDFISRTYSVDVLTVDEATSPELSSLRRFDVCGEDEVERRRSEGEEQIKGGGSVGSRQGGGEVFGSGRGGGTRHEDMAHEDMAHEDMAHEDMAHEDMAHEDMAHEDMAHEDMAHEDIVHEDMYPHHVASTTDDEAGYVEPSYKPKNDGRRRKTKKRRGIIVESPGANTLTPLADAAAARKDDRVIGYVFATGVVVLWGMKRTPNVSKRFTSDLLWFLQHFADGLLRVDRMEEDFMQYCYVDDVSERLVPRSRIKHDVLYLKSRSSSEKAAVSFAFATSIRLCIVERAIEQLSQRVEQVARDMALLGHEMYKLTDTRLLASQFADLYCKIIDLNIVEDFLDIPEYFWEDDQWEAFYRRLHTYLEVASRIAIINQRFTCVKEILKVVNTDRCLAQEVRLTWIIILLLILQVISLVFKDVIAGG